MNAKEFLEVFTGGNLYTLSWKPKAIIDFAEDYYNMKQKENVRFEQQVNAILSKEDNENRVMTAREFIDMIVPEHGRTSCSDDNLDNGLFSRGSGETWHGRCSRCLLLEILEDGKAPEGFEFYECTG